MKTTLRWIVLAICGLGLNLFSASASSAECSVLSRLTSKEITPSLVPVIQAGLRAVFEDDDPDLHDNSFGGYTATRLADLCNFIPLIEVEDEIDEVLWLAYEYGKAVQLSKDAFGWQEPEKRWTSVLGNQAFQATLPGDNLFVRFAAGPTSMLAILGSDYSTDYCDTVGELDEISDEMTLGMNSISELGMGDTTAEICRAFPMATRENAETSIGAQEFTSAMERLGRFETTYSEPLAQIASSAFHEFYLLDPRRVLIRLTGTDAALYALYEEYLAQLPKPVEPTVPPVEYDECPLPDTNSATAYMSFDEDKLARLAAPPALKEVFAKFEGKAFASARDLWAEISPELDVVMTTCALLQTKDMIDLGNTFRLDIAGVSAVGFEADILLVKDVISGFDGDTAPTLEKLTHGLEAAVLAKFLAGEMAQVELAATTLANSADTFAPLTDTAIDGFPPGTPLTNSTQVFAVTADSDRAVASTVSDVDYSNRLAETQFLPAQRPELLKADARRALRKLAERKAAEKTATIILLIENAVVSEWTLGTALQHAIEQNPNVHNSNDPNEAKGLEARMRDLIGISYRTTDQFQDALKIVPGPKPDSNAGDGETPLAPEPGLTKSLTRLATNLALTHQKSTPRHWTPFATGGACVPRRPPSAMVYSFYPFWLAPEAPNEAEQIPALVDFSTVSRLAFYGVEMRQRTLASGDTELVAPNLQRWEEAREVFTDTAHRYRAKVDLALELYDWQFWSSEEIKDAAAIVAEQMNDRPLIETIVSDGWRHFIPNLFDEREPDGITLIFNAEPGENLDTLDTANMVNIINAFVAALPEPDTQTLNIAFDLRLLEIGRKKLPKDLRALLISGRLLDQARLAGWDESEITPEIRDASRKVDKILVFLPRKTTDTKKYLREWMERGDFQGKVRAKILRSLIPVVPSTAHQNVFTRAHDEEPTDKKFSQFIDDIIYFEDNFSGIGFWPHPIEGAVDTVKIAATINHDWNQPALNLDWQEPALRKLLSKVDELHYWVCGFTCPNRGYIMVGVILTALVVVFLVWRAFYIGFVNRLAYDTGLYWLGNGGIGLALALLAICDYTTATPEILLLIQGVSLSLFQILLRKQETAENRP